MENNRDKIAELLDPLIILRKRNMTIKGENDSARVLIKDKATLTDEEKRHSTIEVLDIIGKGGQAVVYKAWDNKAKRKVCVKMAKYKCKNREDVNAAFDREAEFYGKLRSHLNIASMHFSGADGGEGGIRSLVLERCYGNTLEKLISYYKPSRSVPPNVRRKIMTDAASAVQHCSSLGIAHCDLSPRNFVWFPRMDYPVKLIDFGYAVYIRPDSEFKGGSPGYMAPEQILGGKPHEKSDVFGLGCLFHKFYPIKQLQWVEDMKNHERLKDFNTYSTELHVNMRQDLNKKKIGRQDTLLLLDMLTVSAEERLDWSQVVDQIATIGTGETTLDMSESAQDKMKDKSYGEKPVQETHAESIEARTSQVNPDDEGTALEENHDDEENRFTRKHYSDSLAAEQRNDQRQSISYIEKMQGLENGTRFNSKQIETINWVIDEVEKKVEEARQGFEEASGSDGIIRVFTKIEAAVAQIADKGKSEIDRHAEEEKSELKNRVSVLVEKARGKISKLAVTSARPNV